MTGQRLGQAGWPDPSVPNRKEAAREAGFTSSSGGVRAPSVTRSRNCAVRSDEKPIQAESSSPDEFRVRVNRSYPEGIRLLLCISTGARLWRPPKMVRQMKDAERRDKVSARFGEDTRSGQDP